MSKTYLHPELNAVSLVQVMQTLADPCRVAMVRYFLQEPEREFACHEIPLHLSKATISHHLEMLRMAGLIETRVEGTRCLSRVRIREVEQRFPGLLDLVQQDEAS